MAAPTLASALAVDALCALPDSVLALICDDVATVGCCAAACRDLRRVVWDSEAFWDALHGAVARPAREHFRHARFGLEAGFAPLRALAQHAPVEALEQAAHMVGGLCASDGPAEFLELCCLAAAGTDASTAWPALEALERVEQKVRQRELGAACSPGLERLTAARAELLERGALASLDAMLDERLDDEFELDGEVEFEAWLEDGPLPTLRVGSDAPPCKGFFEEESGSDDDFLSVCEGWSDDELD